MNDFSLSPIVLADINTTNILELLKYIQVGIEHIFSYSTDKSYLIKKYFLKVGRVEISYSYNQSVINMSNKMIELLELYPENIDLNIRLQTSEMEFLANIPHRDRIPDYLFSIEVVRKELYRL